MFSGTKFAGKMPLTQEKRLDNNFTNNNDHNYLHKKFKKMASTITVFPVNTSKVGEVRHKDINVEETARSCYISNGSIQAAHPEIEKIKGSQNDQNSAVKYVQTNVSDENTRLSDVNNSDQVSGKTSFNDEFSNKTENLENDFRDVQSGGAAGRYICPYCKLSCAKPSVLQKHIRAHTNERPYPCVPCGFAFKTKSNLYKHRRSRTHALRLQGADVPATINDEDMSGGSESDTSLPPTSLSDPALDASIIRLDNSRPYEFSSPELTNDRITSPVGADVLQSDMSKSKMIYKPKFRAAFYQEAEEKDKLKKTISPNADFLTEHISKIISNNEAIVDVIETPLQKKYGKIKQIAESKQFLNEHDIKTEPSPLNLTKNSSDSDSVFRKRSHSESFSQSDHQKHPLNPEGSIIKDLLLKTKFNGLTSVSGELIDGSPLLYICPLCQIVYKSAENLEIHRLYYCKGNFCNNNSTINAVQKEMRVGRSENVYVRSNSVNVRLPETTNSSAKLQFFNKSPPLKIKPDNLVIVKPESNDVVAPLPSPGPLLGNTRLVDTRISSDYNRKTDSLKAKAIMASPKRRIDSSSDPYSPRLSDNVSPRSADMYSQPKIRCIEANAVTLRSMEDISQLGRHNSTSLQMFGGEVKIVHDSGSTTTLRIEPSKNQLSPILIHPNLSPSKVGNDIEASSVVVRSGLHSGGTIVHNPPTPKEMIGTPKPQTPRISISSVSDISNNLPKIHDITHFQFPPLTIFNPLTLPPLSPSSTPNGASTILHGGKLIPHVPGIPGPNTPGTNVATLSKNTDYFSPVAASLYTSSDNAYGNFITVNGQTPKGSSSAKYEINKNESMRTIRSPNCRTTNLDTEKHFQKQVNSEMPHYGAAVPMINIKNVDEPNIISKTLSNGKSIITKQEGSIKRNCEGIPRTAVLKENCNVLSVKSKYYDKINIRDLPRSSESKAHIEIRNFNFENLITKAEIFNNQIPSSGEVQKNTNAQEMLASSAHNERSETAYFQKNVTAKSIGDDRKPKFLRPSTLPLKPGTFTPKRHHGITPNANTMPLVSPETPRPAKAYGQLYLNGNAYTYLGLKCSTKVFYCTINRPQPTYVPNQHFLSMYSNWQVNNY